MSGGPEYLAEAVTKNGSPLSMRELNGEDCDDSVISKASGQLIQQISSHSVGVISRLESSSWPRLFGFSSETQKFF